MKITYVLIIVLIYSYCSNISSNNSDLAKFIENIKSIIYDENNFMEIHYCTNATIEIERSNLQFKDLKSKSIVVGISKINFCLEMINAQNSTLVNYIFWPLSPTDFKDIVFQIGNLENTMNWKPNIFLFWPGFLKNFSNNQNPIKELYDVNLSLSFPQTQTNYYFDISKSTYIFTKTDVTDSTYRIFDFYIIQLQNNNDLLLKEITLLKNFDFYMKLSRRRNFNGATIKAVAQSDPGYPHESKLIKINNKLKFHSGISIDTFLLFEFTMNLRGIPVQGSGWVDIVNSSWVGMAKQIVENEADISITQSTLTLRLSRFDILSPIFTGEMRIFFRQPSASSIQNLYLLPFNKFLWLGILLIFFTISILIKLFAQIMSKIGHVEEAQFSSSSFYWAISILCQQGFHTKPKSSSVMILIWFGLFTSLVIYSVYSAALVSCLSYQQIPIANLEQLKKTNMHVFGDLYAPYTVYEIINELFMEKKSKLSDHPETTLITQNEALKLIFSEKTPTLAYLTFPDGIISEYRNNFNLTDIYFCQTLYSIKAIDIPRLSVMFLKKNSPFTESFNYNILYFKERGFNRRIIKKYEINYNIKCVEGNTRFRDKLDLNDLFAAFLIFFLGFGTSLVLFICEYFIDKFKNHKAFIT